MDGLSHMKEHGNFEQNDLANHLEKIGIHSSPVALAYDDDEAVNALIQEAMESKPVLDFCREDNLEQTIWRASQIKFADKLLTLFQDKDHLHS